MFNRIVSCASLIMLCVSVQANDCIPTAHRTTGTHYEPVTVQRGDISTGLTIRGQVLATPDCQPVSGARVAHWQAGEDGRYSDRLRAYRFTDSDGRFAFETEWPNISPPHIHFIVAADGYDVLETQWVGGERQTAVDFTMVLEQE